MSEWGRDVLLRTSPEWWYININKERKECHKQSKSEFEPETLMM